ncbi:hypothetical protein HMPREF9451_00554 [Slackia piriformis YIT 12062]|uniref:histidine kinase n=2 Tax=Slackia piriformis TaxID=626934 RepID=K0ZA12_9ACTN|nr:hypothetical protein HMPREF9451_00554 [Slackia piriformis YIT 12062]
MAELEEQAMPSRKKRVFACMRHPVRSLRSYLDACSVKSAFFFYALIGSLAAFAISAVASMALASLSEDVLLNGSGVYPGLYIYDEEENALVKAEDMSWYEAAEGEFTNYANGDEPIVVEGVSLYIESRLSKSESRYRYVIPLNDVPKEAEGIVVHDMDERIVDQGEARDTSIPLDELPAYDAAANAQRGNAVALEAQLPSDSEGNRPAASLVGYYVYVPTTGPAYQAINLSIIVMVPIVFGVCFILASHAFYKRKLQRPIQAMDEAARRIAEGDLSVSMPAPCAGSKSELDRLCASFETMRDALERNNKAMWRMAENRRKVNAAFAHDLRTPLTVLKGRAEMLSTFAPEGLVDAEQLAEASSAMTRQTERLQRYVESMKDLVDMNECSVAPHAGNVGVWFVRAAAEASDLAHAAGKDFEAKAKGLPRFASFDDIALSRVVENILSNALRYADSKVSLACEWDEGVLTVRVSDDGPGFADDALAHGCEPFWREASEKRREDSVHFGLGLNICAELCEKHGGGVKLSNAESGGAVVEAFVEAPLADE